MSENSLFAWSFFWNPILDATRRQLHTNMNQGVVILLYLNDYRG